MSGAPRDTPPEGLTGSAFPTSQMSWGAGSAVSIARRHVSPWGAGHTANSQGVSAAFSIR